MSYPPAAPTPQPLPPGTYLFNTPADHLAHTGLNVGAVTAAALLLLAAGAALTFIAHLIRKAR